MSRPPICFQKIASVLADADVAVLAAAVAVALKTHGVLGKFGVQALGNLHHQGALHPLAEQLKEDFSRLKPIDISKMPNDSLLREFV